MNHKLLLFFSELYAQRGAQIHNSEIMIYRLSQPSGPELIYQLWKQTYLG